MEYNFDGLVGPTHNYAGLSPGNIASTNNYHLTSNPKAAALQGLEKMKLLHDMGVPQAVLPPHVRPNIEFFKSLGFDGNIEKILKEVAEKAPRLFAAGYSASAMWTANAATITPSADSMDKKLHLTPANLAYNIHRALETNYTYHVLQQIFHDKKYFTNHAPLYNNIALGDEGAANHTRFCTDYKQHGVNLFVYGQEYYNQEQLKPKRYPARQTLEASMAVARLHQLDLDKTIFLQQSPEAIDNGVFHNDVCAMGNKNLLLCYESAFVDQQQSLNRLNKICSENEINLKIHQVFSKDLSFDDMVKSYLFNSQLLSINSLEQYNNMLLVAPMECQENIAANNIIENILETDKIIKKVIFVDCRQSMRNGGGPACLRLRVVLNDHEVAAIKKTCNVLFTEELYTELKKWICKHYRDRLSLKDLLDPSLIDSGYVAIEELGKILQLQLC